MNKITIIGTGSVGATIAYTLNTMGIASEIVLIDINTEKALGEALDIRQGNSFFGGNCSIYAGDYCDAAGSNIVILTSGIARKPGQTRLELAQTNVNITKSILPQITKYAPNAIYIIVSNPVDILTYVFFKQSGLPANHIIGSGTVLDTSRLRARLSEYYNINQTNVHAYARCFEIEERLKEMLDIPVFHDDQHGTAIVVLAGIINSLRLTGKKKEDCKVVVNGAGSAGVAITKLLLTYGFTHVTMCDRLGIIGKDYPNLNWMQQKMTEVTNLENAKGTLADALKGADIFVGVSAPNIVTAEMVSSMNKDSILFAMANPVPEIMPDVAKAAGARVVGTGRSDFPNQINNVVAFPGIFKGALEGRATQITEEMKLAAAEALAGLVSDEELNDDFIMPEAFDPRVAAVVSEAVKSHI